MQKHSGRDEEQIVEKSSFIWTLKFLNLMTKPKSQRQKTCQN